MAAGVAPRRLPEGLQATRSTPAATPTSSPPTSGPAWATRPRTPSARRRSPTGASTREMMAAARPDALFMHCLPAHRGEEVEAEVIDGPQSVVWDEAENRMHVQKALMEYLVLGAHRLDGSRRATARARRAIATPMQATAMPSHIVAVGGTPKTPTPQRRDRRREVEQAGHAGRLAAAQQQVEDRVGADRAEHDVVARASRRSASSTGSRSPRRPRRSGSITSAVAAKWMQTAARRSTVGAELALVERAAGDADQRPGDGEQARQRDRRAVDPVADDQRDAGEADARRRASAAPTAARAASATRSAPSAAAAAPGSAP